MVFLFCFALFFVGIWLEAWLSRGLGSIGLHGEVAAIPTAIALVLPLGLSVMQFHILLHQKLFGRCYGDMGRPCGALGVLFQQNHRTP